MITKWLAQALEGTNWTIDEVLDGVERGDFHLFANDKAAVVVEIMKSPRHKIANAWAVGGDINAGGLEGCKSLVSMVEAFSISQGCDIVGGSGRGGWPKVMKSMGYSESPPSFEKEL